MLLCDMWSSSWLRVDWPWGARGKKKTGPEKRSRILSQITEALLGDSDHNMDNQRLSCSPLEPWASLMEHDYAEHGAPHPSRFQRANYYLGIGLLLLVVILWTSSNFVTQVRRWRWNLSVTGPEINHRVYRIFLKMDSSSLSCAFEPVWWLVLQRWSRCLQDHLSEHQCLFAVSYSLVNTLGNIIQGCERTRTYSVCFLSATLTGYTHSK